MTRFTVVGGTALVSVCGILTAYPLKAQDPVETIDVRLLTPVSSAAADGAPVRAISLADPLAAEPLLPPGCELRGSVRVDRDVTRRRKRVALRIEFTEVSDSQAVPHPLVATLHEVDNARETVAEDGAVIGLEPLRVVPSKLETVLLLLAHAHPFLLATAEGVKLARHEATGPGVAYGPGTDMRLALRGWDHAQGLRCGTAPALVPASAGLRVHVAGWPLRTTTAMPDRAADWLNVAFVGPRQALESAFAAAGWMTAARASLQADVKTFVAVASHHGYRSGPVSRLLLDGREPALVFQKQNNTFSKRHHIRLWQTDDRVEGRAVWLGAATHDTGIEFSKVEARLTHRIDGAIDRERAKVVADLAMTELVDWITLVARPGVPPSSRNASGDAITTDGFLAVVYLKDTGF